MTTARKPRSATAARGNATPTPSTEKKSTTTKRRTTKTAARKTADTAALAGSPRGGAIATDAARQADAMSAALQGGAAPAPQTPSPEVLHRMIAEAAYYRAERRGFAPGGEEMDWFAAEAEVRGTERRV